MISEKEMQTDLKVWTEYWNFPHGIEQALAEAPLHPMTMHILRKGCLIRAMLPSKQLISFLKTAALHTTDAVSFPAYQLLRSIKQDKIHPDFEMRVRNLVESLVMVGVHRLDGLTREELFDLDRELAIRADRQAKTTIVMLNKDIRLPLTEEAYGMDRIAEMPADKVSSC